MRILCRRAVKHEHWLPHCAQLNTFVRKKLFVQRHGSGQDLKRAAISYEKTAGVGTDALHPSVLLDLSEETCRTITDVLHVVEVIGKWPAAGCSMFFFLPNTVDSDRLLELLATLGTGQRRQHG